MTANSTWWVGFAIGLLLFSQAAISTPYEFQIEGRVTTAEGVPLSQEMDVRIQFFASETTPDQKIPEKSLYNVSVVEGFFKITVPLGGSEYGDLFDNDGALWYSLHSYTHGITFPRQKWGSVPYAMRVKNNPSHLDYNSLGFLDVVGLANAPLPSGAPSDGQLLKWHSGGWTFEDDNITAAADSVGSEEVLDDSLTNLDISSSAAIQDDKLATISSPGKVNDSALSAAVSKLGGDIDLGTEVTGTLPLTHGGSGATDQVTARGNLGLAALATRDSVTGAEVLDGSILAIDFSSTAAISETKLAPILTPGKVSGDAITQGTISGSTEVSTSGSVSSRGMELKPSGGAASALSVYNDAGDHRVTLRAKGVSAQDLTLSWPASPGSPDSFLSTQGSGQLSWLDAASAGALLSSQNLGDLAHAATARANLGLGALATESAVSGGALGTIADGTLVDVDFAATAQIPDSQLAPISSAGKVSDSALSANVTLLGGDISLTSEVSQTLLLGSGGTGATTASGARSNLGLGSLALETEIAGGSGGFIADGTLMDDDFSASAALSDTKLGAITTSGKVADSALSANVTLLGSDISLNSEVTSTLPITHGGTGSSTATGARVNLGLLGLATEDEVSGGVAGTITDDTLTDHDFASGAAIADTKLAPLASAGKVADSALSLNVSFLGNEISLTSEVTETLPIAHGGLGGTTAALGRSQLGLLGLATEDTVAGGVGGLIVDGTITHHDVASTASISDAKLSTITTPGKVLGSALTSGTIGGSLAMDTTGAIASSGDFYLKPGGGLAKGLKFFDDSGTHFVELKAKNSVGADYTFSLPASDGDAGDILVTNGATGSSWVDPSTLVGDLFAANNLSDLNSVSAARTQLGLGDLATVSVIEGGTGGLLQDGTLTDDDFAAGANIADSKLATIATAGKVFDSALSANVSLLGGDIALATEVSGVLPLGSGGSGATTVAGYRASLGLGSLALLNQVTGNHVVDDSVTEVDLSGSAAISDSKLATISTAGKVQDSALSANVSLLGSDIALGTETSGVLPVASGGVGGSSAVSARAALGLSALATASEVSGGAGGTIADGSLTNHDFSASAAIPDSKLATITTPGKVADSALSANVSLLGSSISLSSEVVGILPLSDGGTGSSSSSGARGNLGLGNLAVLDSVSGGSGGTIVDNTITNHDISNSAGISSTKLATISSAGKVANSSTTATSSSSSNAIVLRDGSGGFSAGAITASSFSGNGTGITNLLKGYIRGAYPDYNSSTSVKITPGTVEVNGKIAIITSDITHSLTSLLSGADMHYIYIDDSQTTYPYGVDIIDSRTEPSYNQSKKGYYNGNDRCIGVVYSPSGTSTIFDFRTNSELTTQFSSWVVLDTNNYANGGWYTLTTSSDPDIPVMASKIFLEVRAQHSSNFFYKEIRTTAGTSLGVCAGWSWKECSLSVHLPRGDRGTQYRNENGDLAGSASYTHLKGWTIER